MNRRRYRALALISAVLVFAAINSSHFEPAIEAEQVAVPKRKE